MERSAPVKLRIATHAGFNQGMATFVAPDGFRSSGESSLVPAERIYLQRDTERRKAAEQGSVLWLLVGIFPRRFVIRFRLTFPEGSECFAEFVVTR